MAFDKGRFGLNTGQDANAVFIDLYLRVVQKVDVENAVERRAVLNLLHAFLIRQPTDSLLAGGVAWTRKVLEQWSDSNQIRPFDDFWRDREPIETASWARLFERASGGRDELWNVGNGILEQGLKGGGDNVVLCQARATMYARRAQHQRTWRDEARDAFSKWAQHAPKNPKVFLAWGRAESEWDSVDDARERLNRGLELVDDPRKRREKGRSLAGDADIDFDRLYARIAIAEMELKARDGKYKTAEYQLREAQDLAPDSRYVWHLQARLLFCQGRFSEALEMLDFIFDRSAEAPEPVNLAVLNTLGTFALHRGYWTKARRYLETAKSIHPENVPTLHALGRLAVEEGRWLYDQKARSQGKGTSRQLCDPEVKFVEAKQRYKEVLKLEADNLYALVGLGKLHRIWASYQGENEGHLACAREYLEKCQFSPVGLHAYGKFHLQTRDFKEAFRCFAAAAQEVRAPYNIPSLIALARVEYQRERDEKKRRQKSGRFYGEVDRLLRHLGDSNDPLFLARQDCVRFLNSKAKLEIELHEVDKAKGTVEQSRGRDEENAYTLLLSAEVFEDRAEDDRKKAERLGMTVGDEP